MTDKELAEILKYSSPKTLYIVTWNNILKLLFCPFRVKVLKNIGDLTIGEVVFVDEIKVDTNLKTVYMIRGKAYYYHNFEIIEN